ncbi:MAG: hypothetical protein K2X48_14380 [Chitinophagaceae bacterium]|nr:hypothetical protein [Chitinophagaceae bacterium]
MNITLIDGHFTAKEALDIITQIIHVKIKFHESKIAHLDNEEDIKMREKRVKQLQKDLYDLRKMMDEGKKSYGLHAELQIK